MTGTVSSRWQKIVSYFFFLRFSLLTCGTTSPAFTHLWLMTCGFREILFVLKIKYIHSGLLTALSVYVLKDKAYRFPGSYIYVHGQPNNNNICICIVTMTAELESITVYLFTYFFYLVYWRKYERKKSRGIIFSCR